MTGKTKIAQTTKITIFGFLILILMGGIILNLPICNQTNSNLLDSMFTSVACVCVAGLSTVTAATQYTFLGKIVMLILMQIGALGFLVVIFAFYTLIKKKITYKEQLMIGESIGSEENLQNAKKMILKVVKYTAIAEGLGTLVLCLHLVPEYGLWKGLGLAAYTAISAFCNCGYDIFGANSLRDFAEVGQVNYLVISVCGILTILGSLGFIVWNEISEKLKYRKKYHLSFRKMWLTFRVHTKIVLVMTIIMFAFGTLGVLLLEYKNSFTLGAYSLGDKIFLAFFQGVSARTTGMTAIDLMNMTKRWKIFYSHFNANRWSARKHSWWNKNSYFCHSCLNGGKFHF